MSKVQYSFVLFVAFIGGLIGGTLASKLLMGSQVFAENKNKPEIITANEFRVVDEEGNIQARFKGFSDGANLQFKKISKELLSKYGVSSESSLPAALYEEVSGITFEGKRFSFEKGPPYVELNMSGLHIQGEKYDCEVTKLGFAFSDRKRGAGMFGSPFIRIGVDLTKYGLLGPQQEYPSIELRDGNRKYRLSIGLHDSGEPYVHLSDDRDRPRAVLGHVELTDKKTKSTIIRHASSLVLFDKDGNVTWSAP